MSLEESLYLKPLVEHGRMTGPEIAKALIRYRLQSSDWTQLADSTVDSQAWAEYRQQLRDLSKQPGFPDDVVWPTAPNK